MSLPLEFEEVYDEKGGLPIGEVIIWSKAVIGMIGLLRIKKLENTQIYLDHKLFFKHWRDASIIILIVYVNNISKWY